MADARGRITVGAPEWGRICDCGNPKGLQARRCWECYVEALRGDDYWRRRTCSDCGGPKTPYWQGPRCHRCASAARVGAPGRGKPQPADHPWRRRIAA